MSKSVLISIQPKWCELILLGKKTLEVRKTRPKLKTPFKCYIYQTKPKDRLLEVLKDGDDNYGVIYRGKPVFIKTFGEVSGYKGLYGNTQKIIGEFVCTDIIEIVKVGCTMTEDPQYRVVKNGTLLSDDIFNYTYLSKKEIEKYLDGRKGYAWHISDLKIYDKPKELSEFRAICRHYDDGLCGDCEYYDYANNESYRYEECAVDGLKPITRPPQSWCYIERKELDNDTH